MLLILLILLIADVSCSDDWLMLLRFVICYFFTVREHQEGVISSTFLVAWAVVVV